MQNDGRSLCGHLKNWLIEQVSYRNNYRGARRSDRASLLSTGMRGPVRERHRHQMTPHAPPDDPICANKTPQIATK
jgi:hypothetical protein